MITREVLLRTTDAHEDELTVEEVVDQEYPEDPQLFLQANPPEIPSAVCVISLDLERAVQMRDLLDGWIAKNTKETRT